MHMMDESNDEIDHRLDLALARLAAATAGPASGFVDRVMARLPARGAADVVLVFARLVECSRELQQQCSAIGSKQELVDWLRRTAARHQLDARPLLAQADSYFTSANDGELDDRALDMVVGAGTPGSHYLTGLLRILADPV